MDLLSLYLSTGFQWIYPSRVNKSVGPLPAINWFNKPSQLQSTVELYVEISIWWFLESWSCPQSTQSWGPQNWDPCLALLPSGGVGSNESFSEKEKRTGNALGHGAIVSDGFGDGLNQPSIHEGIRPGNSSELSAVTCNSQGVEVKYHEIFGGNFKTCLSPLGVTL